MTGYPATIANVAYVAVEQVALLLQWASRALKWRAADRVLKSASATAHERKEASLVLVENEPTGDVFSRSLEFIARGSGSIVAECIFAAGGSFVWPGTGTTIMQLAGNLVCWAVI